MQGDGVSLARQVARRDSEGVARRGGAEKGFNSRPRSSGGCRLGWWRRPSPGRAGRGAGRRSADGARCSCLHMLSPPRPKGRRWDALGVECGRRQLEQNVQKVVTPSSVSSLCQGSWALTDGRSSPPVRPASHSPALRTTRECGVRVSPVVWAPNACRQRTQDRIASDTRKAAPSPHEPVAHVHAPHLQWATVPVCHLRLA